MKITKYQKTSLDTTGTKNFANTSNMNTTDYSLGSFTNPKFKPLGATYLYNIGPSASDSPKSDGTWSISYTDAQARARLNSDLEYTEELFTISDLTNGIYHKSSGNGVVKCDTGRTDGRIGISMTPIIQQVKIIKDGIPVDQIKDGSTVVYDNNDIENPSAKKYLQLAENAYKNITFSATVKTQLEGVTNPLKTTVGSYFGGDYLTGFGCHHFRYEGTDFDEICNPTLVKNDNEDLKVVDVSNNNSEVTVTSQGKYTNIYNFIPGHTYKIYKSTSNTLIKEFTPTGTLRMLNIPGISNFRDLGGWTGYNGKKLNYGVLFRSSMAPFKDVDIARYTSNGIFLTNKALADNNIKGRIDLRLIDTTNYDNSDIPDNKYSAVTNSYDAAVSTNNCIYYNLFDTNNTGLTSRDGCFKIIFGKIASFLDNGGVYFHCTQGKDRTGTLAFLLMALCGVQLKDLMKDYELTDFREYGYNSNGVSSNIYIGTKSSDFNTMVHEIYTYCGGADYGFNLQQCILFYLLSPCTVTTNSSKPTYTATGAGCKEADVKKIMQKLINISDTEYNTLKASICVDGTLSKGLQTFNKVTYSR